MKRILAWFAANGVAANLLMLVIIAGGLLAAFTITQEIFPEFEVGRITVTAEYLGAAPEEVEEGVCVRIEEAIQGLDGIERITSTAAEGVGVVIAELMSDADSRKVLDDVKARVDAIDTFPDEVEEPVTVEVTNRYQVTNVAVHGDAEERTLRVLAERARDEISAIDGITQAELMNVRPFEIAVEVSEEALRRHGLRFDDVANAVRRSSLDLPAGSVKTEGGEILLRTKGQAYVGDEFESLVLLTRPDGTRVTLGEVAEVVDGFADTDQWTLFDGKPAIQVAVYRVGSQNALDVSAKVHAYVKQANARLPEGVSLAIWQDGAEILQSRLDLLKRNAMAGFALVFLMLALFLRLRLAFWVSLGIPISFLGAIWLMPLLGVTINMVSLFAFIVVLGIVVDDAIVVGENIFSYQEKVGRGHEGAVRGVQEVMLPVTFAVLTSVAAFTPLLAIEGTMGKIMRVIPIIVISTLVFSLVESLLVLPNHLSHTGRQAKASVGIIRLWAVVQGFFAGALDRFIRLVYEPSLVLGLRWRYLTVAVGVATLVLTLGLVLGGHVAFTFFPDVEADFIVASVTMPQGTPAGTTGKAVQRIEDAAMALREELEGGVDGSVHFRHIQTAVGDHPMTVLRGQMARGPDGRPTGGSHLAEVTIELVPSEERLASSTDMMARWRELTGPIAEAVELTFNSSLMSQGAPIDVQIAGGDLVELREAATRLRARLAEYPGVYDVTDTYREGKQELQLQIRPEAEALGLTLGDLARQVRQGFYGEEAQRVQRGRDDIRVMVRYPEVERRSLGSVEGMRIRTPDGREVPFSSVAEASLGRAYSTVERADRRRTLRVTGNVDTSITNAGQVLAALAAGPVPEILGDYAGMTYSFEGQQREQRKTLGGLARGFVMALLVIFALLAISFRSYLQPLIVMSAIPFGLVGAVWGHAIMGLELTIMSAFGLVALTGVVVNDSLVMVHFVNRKREDENWDLLTAAKLAGKARFRPILLTSLTTFAGLTPLLLEKSMQAKFMVPMAVSLAFGVVFATFITLMLVPCGYVILEDVKSLVGRLFRRLGSPPGAGAAGTAGALPARDDADPERS